jgi:hypothetical protein
MSKINNPKLNSKSDSEQSNRYQIRVKGNLDPQWSDWFEGMAVKPDEDGTTLITGVVVDDAALHGLLKRVRDSGLRLLSVNQVENILAEDDASGQSDNVSPDKNEKDGSI